MENSWDEARASLDIAEKCLRSDSRESRAELLLLKAEVALCGAPQDLLLAERCLFRAKGIVSDLCRRAAILGHLSLTLLALHRFSASDDARQEAFTAAQDSGSLVSLFESHLFGAHCDIALMRLESAMDHVEKMRQSSYDGRISDSDVHRYAGRVCALSGDFAASGAAYCQLLLSDLDGKPIHMPTLGWCLTHIALQVDELHALGREAMAEEFISTLVTAERWNYLAGLHPLIEEIGPLIAKLVRYPGRVRAQPSLRTWFGDLWHLAAVRSYDFYTSDVLELRDLTSS
jgi:hypothetical protein